MNAIAVNYNPIANIDDTSCAFLSDNVNLLSTWADTSLVQNSLGGSYTDVYGIAINSREYAVIGSTMGTHIIDVTNPTLISEVAFVPGAFQGSGVTHRDYFQMDNYLYAVCDQGTSTLQVIDISNLPNSVNIVYDSDALIATSHNLFIDQSSSLRKYQGTLYISPRTKVPGGVSGINTPVRFEDKTSKLILEDAELKVDNDTGVMFINGNLIVEGNCIIDNASTETTKALFLGAGVLDKLQTTSVGTGDCKLTLKAGSELKVKNAGIVWQNKGVGSFDFEQGRGQLEIDKDGNFLFSEPVLFNSHGATFDFTKFGGKTMRGEFNGLATVVNYGVAWPGLTCDFSPDGKYIALGMWSSGKTGVSQLVHVRNLFDVRNDLNKVSLGLKPERANIEAREVHGTQLGRICPMQTPEQKNLCAGSCRGSIFFSLCPWLSGRG
jgi:hypothetical protein